MRHNGFFVSNWGNMVYIEYICNGELRKNYSDIKRNHQQTNPSEHTRDKGNFFKVLRVAPS